MSWTFFAHQINRSFEQLGMWYQEFMVRCERSFRALHERITYLENRQAWQGPSDEQVERVLRKVLAERFADAGVQRVVNPNDMKDGAYFVKNPNENNSIATAIPLDVAALQVDPEAIPSKAYSDTFRLLETRLSGFPEVDLSQPPQNDMPDGKETPEFKRPKAPSSQSQSKPWS